MCNSFNISEVYAECPGFPHHMRGFTDQGFSNAFASSKMVVGATLQLKRHRSQGLGP